MSDEEKLKEKMIQNQEAMQLCSQETKKLEEMMLRNQKLIQRTNEDMKKMQQLQVSGSVLNVIFIKHRLLKVNAVPTKSGMVFL